jgi:hypothetical protein
MEIINYIQELESQEYKACRFELDNQKIVCRTAKITPTKAGQFVTIWKRNELGKTCPFEEADEIDLIIINCVNGQNTGYFKFPKDILITKRIISTRIKVGKMGIRIYPTWDKADNPQAIRTQKWQLEYFQLGNKFNFYR